MRDSWDTYFMKIAQQVASRATCDRKHVGAVFVSSLRHILATGYNGSAAGLPHCDDVGHMMEDEHCVRTIHAEANAICQAARNGVGLADSTCYVTASPCWPCFKLMANSGVRRVVYGEFYRDERIFEAASTLGIDIAKIDGQLSDKDGSPYRTQATQTTDKPANTPANTQAKAVIEPTSDPEQEYEDKAKVFTYLLVAVVIGAVIYFIATRDDQTSRPVSPASTAQTSS